MSGITVAAFSFLPHTSTSASMYLAMCDCGRRRRFAAIVSAWVHCFTEREWTNEWTCASHFHRRVSSNGRINGFFSPMCLCCKYFNKGNLYADTFSLVWRFYFNFFFFAVSIHYSERNEMGMVGEDDTAFEVLWNDLQTWWPTRILIDMLLWLRPSF